MKSFKKFIAESPVVIDFKEMRSIATMPEATKMPKRNQAFLDYLDKLEAALEKGEIYNVEYQDAKSMINTHIRYIGGSFFNMYREVMRDNDIWIHVHDMRDNEKIFKGNVEQLDLLFPELMRFLKKTRGIFAVLEKLKPMIKKGKRPTEPNPNAYNKPMAPLAATRMVSDILTNAITVIKLDIFNTYEKIFRKRVEDIIALAPTSTNDIRKMKDSQAALAFRLYDTYPNFRLKPNWEEFVRKEAENVANDIVAQFVAKNTKKLALIFSKKEGLASHKILSNRVNANGILENTMSFEFTDGSGFTIYSQVEYSYSKNQKPFLRLPTRFSNVKFANGEMMKTPSEEKMDKEF